MEYLGEQELMAPSVRLRPHPLHFLIHFLLMVSWTPAWTQRAARLQLTYKDLQLSNSSVTFLGSRNTSSFQALLLDEDRGWLLAGAKNYIFLLRLDNLNDNPHKIYWPAAKDHVEHCKLAGKNEETECANFVRLLQHFNKTHVYACGTGAFHPLCTYIDLGRSTEKPVVHLIPHLLESGRGKCPFSPHESFTALLTTEGLYAGTSVDFMGTNAAIFRTTVQGRNQHYIRTEANQDNWLNDPQFIGSFSIPDTRSPDDDKIYFFFKEMAVESNQWDKRIFSRVARVCKNDVGGKRSLINRWTTFLKARLVCSVPGPNGMETYFDELEDIFLLETRDEQNPLIFGVFSASGSVFKGSAVCVYSMASIRAVFNGPFAHRESLDYRWVEYKGRIPYPRPGTCPSETYDPLHKSTQDFPDDVISFMRSHQLMWEVVYPLNRKPVFMKAGGPFLLKKLVVDRVDAEDGQYDVMYLGTDEGKILKVIMIPKQDWSTEEIILEEISVFQKPSPIVNMEISTKRQLLYVSTVSELAQVSLHRCELYGKVCADCCLARDPYCAWDGSLCTRYFPTNKRRARRQDVKHGDPRSQCHDLEEGFEAVEDKVMYGVEMNSTYLECIPRSHQAMLKWTVQHPRNDHVKEVKSDERFIHLEQGLLIRLLEKSDAGIYSCLAEENSFSHTLVRYHLRIIEQEHVGAQQSQVGGATGEMGRAIVNPPTLGQLQMFYKDYTQLKSISGMSADEYCDQLWYREKRKQKLRNFKWKQTVDNRKGRLRRHPGQDRDGPAV
ncbi:SEM3D protein, partial [Polypterus senegalus]|nr:semaphorin-3D [Polypterus senegalus]XP_039629224.1 semaphorin-3D [Polypterus senegalus]MBN3290882.1 SEM3D protein [Polypterus senegalus]